MTEAAFIRVEKGNPGPDELAALTVVLLAVASGGRDAAAPRTRPAAWRRPERSHGFCAPHSWQAAPIHLPRPRSPLTPVGTGSAQS